MKTKDRAATPPEDDQGNQWSRHADEYEELFLDAFQKGVESPLIKTIEAIPKPKSKTVIDLGCGIGPLLPRLVERFKRVYALDFAPNMIVKSKQRLGADASKVTFLNREMHALDDLAGTFDVALAVNSVVMPDTRRIDQTLKAIRASLKPDGYFLGVVPSIDAIHYHTMLLMDRSLDRGASPEEAERYAAFHAEHHYYDFAIGRFTYKGLRQKFWQPFELEYRLRKAGFTDVELDQLFYPWDESIAESAELADEPRTWDWTFSARP